AARARRAGSIPSPGSDREWLQAVQQYAHQVSGMGDFADLSSPFLVGHSSGVAALAARAGELCRLDSGEETRLRRAGLVHDLGRVAVPVRVWQKVGSLTPGEWERVRLHAYCTERVLTRSAFLATHTGIAGAHHERLDGSGYHRG